MTDRTPIDLLRLISPAGAESFMDHRAAVMANPELQVIPTKHKLLIGVAVAAALQSSSCTLRWTQQATDAGATPAEIAEAIVVARFIKMATVNGTAADAMAWLESKAGQTDTASN